MSDLFDAPAEPIPRDRWGRPLVVPPGGGKPTAYTRCTTFVDVLDDKYNLQQWQQRMVAIGLADRPDLLLAVSAHRDDKRELNSITSKARDAAAAGAAATTGTALHALTERVDRGEELPAIPQAYRADLEAYREATVGLEPVAIEQFVVEDGHKIGGTRDRLVRHQGRLYVADVKTGSVDYGAMKIAMQLAVYARSTPYNHATGVRTPVGEDVDTDRALVIHLPAGQGRCELRWIDIARGWSAVETAAEVRRWRSVKDWFEPFATATADGTTFDPVDALATGWELTIAEATTVDEVRRLYAAAVADGVPGEAILPACLSRKDDLEGAS